MPEPEFSFDRQVWCAVHSPAITETRQPIEVNGRGGLIRTDDPLLPKQMRYQAALRPDKKRTGLPPDLSCVVPLRAVWLHEGTSYETSTKNPAIVRLLQRAFAAGKRRIATPRRPVPGGQTKGAKNGALPTQFNGVWSHAPAFVTADKAQSENGCCKQRKGGRKRNGRDGVCQNEPLK